MMLVVVNFIAAGVAVLQSGETSDANWRKLFIFLAVLNLSLAEFWNRKQ